MTHVGQVFLDPLFDSVVSLALSYALRRRAPRVAFALPALAMGLLLFFASNGVSDRLAYALENPVLTSIQPDVTYDAVIVLGGTMNGMVTVDTHAPAYDEAVERILATYDLLRTNRARFAIVSGTSWDDEPGEAEPESRIIKKQLVEWGIDPARIATDDVSRDTHQNAIESVRIARERGWTRDVLVTSAAHMKRARGCFAKQGLAVDTLSVDFAAWNPALHRSRWGPSTASLSASTAVIREWAARIVYRLRGWTD